MSNNYQNEWDDDDFDTEDDDFATPEPSGNDLVKKLRKANRASERRLKELEAELQTLRQSSREMTVSKILESEGVNPRIAKFIPAEVQDSDAVKAWLADNAEVFGFTKNEQSAQIRTNEPNVDWRSIENMDSVLDGALSATQLDDQYNALAQAQSMDDIRRLVFGAE